MSGDDYPGEIMTAVDPALPAAVSAYYERVTAGDWSGFDALWRDPVAGCTVREAARSWRMYSEQPRIVWDLAGVLVVQSDFFGVTHAGTAVQLDAVTAFELDGERIGSISGWQARADTDRHCEIPGLRVVMAYFDAANGADWTALGRTWAPEAELVAVGGPPRRGRESIVRAYRGFLGLFSTYRDRVDRVVISGRSVTVTGHLSATSARGALIELDWIDQIDLSSDLCHIERLSHWHDRDRFHSLMDSG
jgi:hypothetical protein